MSNKNLKELREQSSETLSSKEKKSPESENQAQERPTLTGNYGSSPSGEVDDKVKRLADLCDELYSKLSDIAFKATELRENIKAIQEKAWDYYLKISTEVRRLG